MMISLSARRRIKSLALTTARLTGLQALARGSSWRRERLLILCYHGIATRDEHLWDPELYVPADFLRRRLQALRRGGYAILRLDEGLRRMAEGTLPPRSVVLTFDDGAADFATHAVPVLREFEAPATVYVTTYYVERRLPVFDTMLSYLLWRGRASGVDVGPVIGGASLPLDAPEARRAAWREVQAFVGERALGAVDKDAVLRAIAARLGVDYEELRAARLLEQMTPQEVAALPGDLIDVQLHTHRHRSPRGAPVLIRELVDNRAALARMRPHDCFEHFCYPSGSYYGEHLEAMRTFGVRSATTCVPGLASRGDAPLLLPRFIDTLAVDDATFEAWCSGLAALLPRTQAYRLDAARLALPTPSNASRTAPSGGAYGSEPSDASDLVGAR